MKYHAILIDTLNGDTVQQSISVYRSEVALILADKMLKLYYYNYIGEKRVLESKIKLMEAI